MPVSPIEHSHLPPILYLLYFLCLIYLLSSIHLSFTVLLLPLYQSLSHSCHNAYGFRGPTHT